MRRVIASLVASVLLTPGAAQAMDSKRPDGEPRSSVPVFVLEKGRYSSFDPPGVAAQDFVGTNNRGQITGGYKTTFDSPADQHGFLRDRRGRLVTIDVPGATVTSPIDINDRGEVVGLYSDQADGSMSRGFLRDKRGKLRRLHVPRAVYTQAFGIDNRGRVVGDYLGDDGVNHGFLWQDGRFTTIDGPTGTGATLTDINDHGEIVGVSADPAVPGTIAGFLLSRGTYTSLARSGATFTLPFGLNNKGQIVGVTSVTVPGAGVAYHGFVLRSGANGPFTPVDVPGAPSTLATDIDDRGRIVGIYVNPDGATNTRGTSAEVPMDRLMDGLIDGLADRPRHR
jgi:probable HAF family extracellular repeat protein